MPWYTVRIEDRHYAVIKFDDLFFLERVHEIYRHPTKDWAYICITRVDTCPLNCRHKIILSLFKQNDKIDKGWFYDYDTQEWMMPITVMKIRKKQQEESNNSLVYLHQLDAMNRHRRPTREERLAWLAAHGG